MPAPPHPIPRLYAIADAGDLGAALPEAVEAMAASGVGWVQIRAKALSGAELDGLVADCRRRLGPSGPALWIDDRSDVARIHGLSGVHLGQRDLPPKAARRVVGDAVWIGLSTHDPNQVAAADADPDVDVVAIGPVFATASKSQPDPVVGLEGVAAARRRTGKPLVAIGGIDADRLPAVLAAGADAGVVLSAVCRGDVRDNCRRLLEAAGEAR